MSLSLETLDRGFVGDFGYSSCSVRRVLLGELPAMPTPQFCQLATAALLEFAPRLGDQDRHRIGEKLQLAYLRDQQTKLDQENSLELPKILPDNDNGFATQPYTGNPLKLEADHLVIGGLYHLSFLEFGLFAAIILAGGIFGWDTDQGMPKTAKDAIAKLQQIWPIRQTFS